MEAIVKHMLLGTSKLGTALPPSTNEAEELVARVEPPDAESHLLLRAGAWAAYTQAGRRPQPASPPPEPAPAEGKPVPSARGIRLLEELFAQSDGALLAEALRRLDEAGLRLPEHLLPAALDIRDEQHRPYVAAVLGERGVWLSRLNPDWAWVTATGAAGDALSEDADEIWDSGTIHQREALLRQVRRHAPARGLDWLRKSWGGEKAEHRARLLAALEVGLSGEDVEFLEAALTDRAMRVRAQAAELLVRVDGSALLANVCTRVDACLAFKPPPPVGGLKTRLKALAGYRSVGELIATPPQDVEATWKRDGIIPPPPQNVGPRAWWLSRMIGLVAPAHWERRFGVPSSELLSAGITEEWEQAVLVGWTQAALLHDAGDWLPALWDRWMGPAGLRGEERVLGAAPGELLGPLLARMSPEASRERVIALIDEGRVTPFWWFRGLEYLATPWPVDVGRAYLQHVRRRARAATQVANMELQTLERAARALPPECFEEALRDWGVPETNDYYHQYWRRELARFTEIVLLRQRIAREIV